MKKTIFNIAMMTFLFGSSIAQIDQDSYQDPFELPEKIQSEGEDFFPIMTEDGTMYFCRFYSEENVGGKQSGHDIWMTKRNPEDSTWSEPVNMTAWNNKGNNAVVGISKDGNHVYLYNDYAIDKNSQPALSMSTKTADGWDTPMNMNLMGLQPTGILYGMSVSSDENVVFVSQKTESDSSHNLYVSTRISNGTWTSLEKVEGLNSDSTEISPYLSYNSEYVYFSSNREGGEGGYDIYRAKRLDDSYTKWGEVENLGETINTDNYEAYFMVTPDEEIFFTSNQNGGLSNIYRSEIMPEIIVEVPDSNQIVLVDTAGNETTVDYAGNHIIFFDFNQDDLRNKSKSVLDSVRQLLAKNPDLKVNLEGHCDSIDTYSYNKTLSLNRAQSAKAYLSKLGVNENQITTLGFSEGRPIAPNSTENGKDNPEGRQLNRRVEILLYTEQNELDDLRIKDASELGRAGGGNSGAINGTKLVIGTVLVE